MSISVSFNFYIINVPAGKISIVEVVRIEVELKHNIFRKIRNGQRNNAFCPIADQQVIKINIPSAVVCFTVMLSCQ